MTGYCRIRRRRLDSFSIRSCRAKGSRLRSGTRKLIRSLLDGPYCATVTVSQSSPFSGRARGALGRLSTPPLPLPDAGRKFGILAKEDYLPTPFVAGFIEALRTVAKQLQQDVIADAS